MIALFWQNILMLKKEACLETFSCQDDFKSLAKENTCFKNSSKPTTNDLFLTISKTYFQNTKTIFTGLSDFYKLVVTMLNINFLKNKPPETNYRNYNHFDEVSFKEDL